MKNCYKHRIFLVECVINTMSLCRKRKTLLFSCFGKLLRHEIYLHNHRLDNFPALLMCTAGVGMCGHSDDPIQ